GEGAHSFHRTRRHPATALSAQGPVPNFAPARVPTGWTLGSLQEDTMNRKLSALVIAVGAACATPAFADVVEVYTTPTGRDVYYVPQTTYFSAPATTYYYTPAPTYYYAPATTYTYVEPTITVEAPRYYNDPIAINNE